jgi:hypothetical protein
MDQFEVLVYAEDEYAATTIALVAGTTYTITDSANKFVTEGFKADMALGTDQTGNEGPYKIASVAVGTITLSGLVPTMTAVTAGSTVTLTSRADFGYLPSDFWGLGNERPYIDGETWELDPLPSQEVELAYTSAAQPQYFKIRNDKIYVIPATSSDITLKGDYFQRPTKLTASTDTMPFNELFDEVIAEVMVRYYGGGLQGEAGLMAMRLFIQEQVDTLVSGRDFRAPKQMPKGGINWNALS